MGYINKLHPNFITVYWIIREFITVTITNPNCTQVFPVPWSKYGPFHGKSWKNMTLAFYRYRNMTLWIDNHQFCGKKSGHGWSSTMPWLHVFSWFHPSYGTMVSYETKIGQLWLRKTTQLVLSEGDDKNQLLVQSMMDQHCICWSKHHKTLVLETQNELNGWLSFPNMIGVHPSPFGQFDPPKVAGFHAQYGGTQQDTMGFNPKSWSSMTRMIMDDLGVPLF